MKLRIVLSAFITNAFLFGAAPAHSAEFPSRPLTLVVPFAAGSTTDVSARIAALQMSKTLGQPIVVENKVGAGGTIGASIVARSAPDGYTLLWASSSVLAIAPHVMSKLPWDPVTSFTPIGLVARIPMIIATTNSLPVKSFRDLVDLARARPGKLSYATPGPNTMQNLAMSLMTKELGVSMNHVPYNNVSLIYSDLIEGRLDVVIDNVANVLPFIHSDKLRPIAVVTPKRLDVLPNVPTVSESKLIDFSIGGWIGVVTPAGTPPQIVEVLNRATSSAARSSEFRTWMKNNGATLVEDGSSQYFATFLPKEVNSLKSAVEASGGLNK